MKADDPRLQLVPPGALPRQVMFGLGVVLPVVACAVAVLAASQGAHPRLVAGSLALTLVATVGGTALLVGTLWWILDRMMRRQSLRLGGDAIEITSSFYRSTTPFSTLRLDHARVVDLDEHRELAPGTKTNGYALPGFKSGHFKLRDGTRAFVAIAGERRALWLPTVDGKGLLLQPRQPDALLARLREHAVAPAFHASTAGPPLASTHRRR